MTNKFLETALRLLALALLLLATACGRGDNSGDTSEELVSTGGGIIISDDATANAFNGGERELTVTDATTAIETVTQCLCLERYRSTLQFYHFEDQNAVLLIEFDNQVDDFSPTASVLLFDINASGESISNWINNQHSDGLLIDVANPLVSHSVSADAIAITSTVFVESISGDTGDEYEQTRIEFTVANVSEPDQYFLNGFADQSVVYLQTR